MRQLATDTLEEREAAAEALRKLSANADNQVAVARGGGIENLVRLLQLPAVTPGEREAAARALGNLSANADNRIT